MGPPDGAGELAAAPFLRRIDVFADHHRIVHEHAQRQNEAHDGHGVDGIAEPVHQEDGAEEGDGDSGSHPQRQVRAQKKRQQDEHEKQPLHATVQQSLQTVGQGDGCIPPDRQLDACGIRRCGLRHELSNGPAHGSHILVADPEHLHQGGGLALELQALAGILEAIHNLRDVVERHPCAVAAGGDGQLFQFVPPVGLSGGAQQDFPPVGLHRAPRQIQRPFAQGLRHVLEGQVVARQGCLGDLNGNLVGPFVDDGGLGDAGQPEQVVAHPAAHLLERALVHRPGYGNLDDHVLDGCRFDDGLLGLFGKGVDRVNAVFHLAKRLHAIRVKKQFDLNGAQILCGDRAHFPDSADALQAFLDAGADPGFDLLGGGAQVRDRYDDQGHIDIGVELDGNAIQGGQARKN